MFNLKVILLFLSSELKKRKREKFHKLIIEKTIYGSSFKTIKVDKAFQIPLIEDRTFRYTCYVYPKVIIKYLAGVCNIDENIIE